MRLTYAVLALLLLVSAPTLARAEGGVAPPAKPAPVLSKQQKLDALFLDLKRAKTQAAADGVARRIVEEWTNSGSATIDLLMQWSLQAIEKQSYPVALDFLDQVIVLQPDYAEGWNRRATVHFLMNNYSKSMADIEKTLQLEPRHYLALSGMGQIFLALDRKELALKAYERVLELFPMKRDIQNRVGELADELAGSRI